MKTALKTAQETAEMNGLNAPTAAIDTRFPDHPTCLIITQDADSALVVYDDKPDCVCSVSNENGRFIINADEEVV